MVLSTPKQSAGAPNANREVPHLTLDGENSIVMEYLTTGLLIMRVSRLFIPRKSALRPFGASSYLL